MLFKQLRVDSQSETLTHIPQGCEACASTDIVNVPLTIPDKEAGVQRRYQCRACLKYMLVASCDALNEESNSETTTGKPPSTPANPNISDEVLSEYESKVAALEGQLSLIDQDIDNSQRIADAQEAELMRTKLGAADLRNVEAVAVKHARVLTLLNELHRTHYSKELVLTETEHERDQLRHRLEAAQARFSEMEAFFRGESNKEKEARDAAMRENQELKKLVLTLEGGLSSANEARAVAIKNRNEVLNENKVLVSETALEISELKSQLNVVRTTLKQTEVSAEREQIRLMTRVRELESKLYENKDSQSVEAKNKKNEQGMVAGSVAAQPICDKREEHSLLAATASNESCTDDNAASQQDVVPELAAEKYREAVKYIKGDGVAKNEQTAATYFEQAADLGHPAAQHNLGALKFRGPEALRNLDESIYWLSLAAAQGHKKAIALLPEVEAANRLEEVRNIAL